jgi:hypothetical protein
MEKRFAIGDREIFNEKVQYLKGNFISEIQNTLICRNIDEFLCTQYSDKQLGDDHRKLY